MKIIAIVNPKSGENEGAHLANNLEEFLAKGEPSGKVHLLEHGVPMPTTSEISKFDLVLVCGGDGTVSAVLPSLDDNSPPLLIAPLGTANDLARELGHLKAFRTNSLPDFIMQSIAMEKDRLSLWRVEWGSDFQHSKLLSNYASLGFDAYVAMRFDDWRSKGSPKPFQRIFNRLKYGTLGLRNIGYKFSSTPKISKTSDNARSVSANVAGLIIANIRSYMGLGTSNSNGDPFDEACELILMPHAISYLSIILGKLFPFLRPNYGGSSNFWKIDELPIGTQLQIDGEPVHDFTGTRLRIIPSRSISVIKFST